MEPFTAAAHDDVLRLVLQIGILLLTARVLSEVAQRLGQPSVIGELLAGILLGPSLLSTFAPAVGMWLIPQTDVQGYLLEVVSLIGAMFLLLITGLETDIALIRRHARTAIGVSAGGILVTFSTGFLLGQLLPDFLLADSDSRLVFALFVATAMSISAIPVIAKVLMDLRLMRRDIGQTIIAAGMSDDTVGWILLSVVAGLASGEAITAASVVQTVGGVLAFVIVSFTAGRWFVRRLLNFVQDKAMSRDALLTLVVVLTFLWGAITQALHLEAVLGAFVMGILFAQMRRLPREVHQRLETIALGVFSPIFFAVAGLKVNLLALLTPTLIAIAFAVIAVATLGKVVGTYLGARMIGGRDHWTSLSFGAGLNARGAMEIIIATIGLQLGILSQDMFSIIVVMAMATSLMAPAALKWVLARVEPSEEEVRRLQQEALEEGSLIANVHRVLLPVRYRAGGVPHVQQVEARLLEQFGRDLSITLFTVVPPHERAEAHARLAEIAKLFVKAEVVRRVREADDPGAAILDEAARDYDLLILGASEKSGTAEVVFNLLTDHLVRFAPCPTMVVKPHVDMVWPPGTILVPFNGTAAARTAAEVAFAVAGNTQARVTLLTVLERADDPYDLDLSQVAHARQLANAYDALEEARGLGESRGVLAETEVRFAEVAEEAVLETASRRGADLIVLGSDVRVGTNRLHLGPRIEAIIDGAPCPLVLVNGGPPAGRTSAAPKAAGATPA